MSDNNVDKPVSEQKDAVLLDILQEIKAMRQEVAQLNSHKLVAIYSDTRKLLFLQFLRGVLTGFGGVIGATILVSLAVYALSKIEFVPIIGQWGKSIIQEIQK